MYTLKTIAQRGTLFGAAAALVVAAILPATAAFADALNPLTERSLLLSSSAPGWQNTDGSGNTADSPNSIGENYAPAGSGPNGMRSGETFSFKVSSTAGVKAFGLQYCTTAAGLCQAPGDNTGDADPNKDGDTADSTRQSNADARTNNVKKSDLEFVGSFAQNKTDTVVPGAFQVMIDGVTSTEDWAFTAAPKEDATFAGPKTGTKNYVTLTSATGETISNGQKVTIVFSASETVHITNPGSKAFFVKLNTYDSDTSGDMVPGGAHNVDGGVTVANVMTDSIHITTKVLETMAFSVGTHNPDTDEVVTPVTHGTCDAIDVVNGNRLNLGNPNAEYSLETGRAWDVASYWRLSSNSSGGATVYYSGDTLRNTVGDSIRPIQRAAANTGAPVATDNKPGSEQFGLAYVPADAEVSSTFTDAIAADTSGRTHLPNVAPLNMTTAYATGAGQAGFDDSDAITAKFAFDDRSLLVPAVIAQNNDAVLSCATGKMRYVGNIAADTPAGVYTTKINYLAAPQY